jgi:hypothetical protein
MKDHIVTASDVADATGQPVEIIARRWREISKNQSSDED